MPSQKIYKASPNIIASSQIPKVKQAQLQKELKQKKVQEVKVPEEVLEKAKKMMGDWKKDGKKKKEKPQQPECRAQEKTQQDEEEEVLREYEEKAKKKLTPRFQSAIAGDADNEDKKQSIHRKQINFQHEKQIKKQQQPLKLQKKQQQFEQIKQQFDQRKSTKKQQQQLKEKHEQAQSKPQPSPKTQIELDQKPDKIKKKVKTVKQVMKPNNINFVNAEGPHKATPPPKNYLTSLDQASQTKNPTIQKVHLEQGDGEGLGQKLHNATSAMVVNLRNKQKKKRQHIQEIIDDDLPDSQDEKEAERILKEEEDMKRVQQEKFKENLLRRHQEQQDRQDELDKKILSSLGKQKKQQTYGDIDGVIKRKSHQKAEEQVVSSGYEEKQNQRRQNQLQMEAAQTSKLATNFLDKFDKKFQIAQQKKVMKQERQQIKQKFNDVKRESSNKKRANDDDDQLSDWDEDNTNHIKHAKKQVKKQLNYQKQEEFDYNWDDDDDDQIVSPPKKARKIPPPKQSGQGLPGMKKQIQMQYNAQQPIDQWD